MFPNFSLRDFGISIENLKLTIEVPQEIDLAWDASGIGAEPKITSENGRKTYQWVAENLPAVVCENYIPSSDQLLPHIWIAPSKIQVGKYHGSMLDWNSFGKFMGDLVRGRDQLPAETAAEVHQITDPLNTNLEKIDALYKFMQDEMRYVSVQLGIGGWQPFPASYVAENKFGDCKALSNYMKAMLREAGIASNLAVVYGGRNPGMPPKDMAYPNLFNHMILYIPDEDLWLECTSSDNPTGYLSAWTAGRKALVITSEGGKLMDTPTYDATKNRRVFGAQVKIKADGGAEARVQEIYSGTAQDALRSHRTYYGTEEVEKEHKKECSLPNAKIDDWAMSVAKDSAQIEISYQAYMNKYASKSGKRLFVPVNAIQKHENIPPSDDGRIHPVKTRLGYTEELQLEMVLPDGFIIESKPDAVELFHDDYGIYRASISQKEGKWYYTRYLQMKAVDLAPEKYTDWRDFHLKVAKADKAKLVLINNDKT